MEERTPDQPTTQGLAFLGAVAGGLVHEIRNPLSAMSMTLQLLEEDWPEGEGDERARRTARRLRTVRLEVGRLSSILEDFLRYAGIRRLDLREADINRVLEEVCSFIAPECARAGSSWRSPRPQPAAPAPGRAFAPQALLNLLLNAVQAMEEMPAEAEAVPRVKQLIVRRASRATSARGCHRHGPRHPRGLAGRVWQVYAAARRGAAAGPAHRAAIAEEHAGSLVFETALGKGTDPAAVAPGRPAPPLNATERAAPDAGPDPIPSTPPGLASGRRHDNLADSWPNVAHRAWRSWSWKTTAPTPT
jgi:nitrogen fixation/metabolism regulation signal transduction histidine kinase